MFEPWDEGRRVSDVAAHDDAERSAVSPFWQVRWWIFTGLVILLGAAIYLPVRHFEFLNFDDNRFISENPWLKRGLGAETVRWAFTANLTDHSHQAEYWSPLTLLSRLTDAQVYGMHAGPFHITNALLHFVNALLLCGALYHLTGQWGRSALVALLFLVHPLNVEPVCWLSARKDLLSATFFFATLLAYAFYVRRQTRFRYLVLLASFAACLMAKPMGVTIPFILLLLDTWPLQRWKSDDRAENLRLIGEKVPLLMLAAGGAVLAVFSQEDTGAIQPAGVLAVPLRVENALVSYGVYVRRVFWPNDLAIYYPHPGPSLSIWSAVGAAIFLVAITATALRLRRRAPYVLTGWLWFGIVLGPVIGLVQIGGQAMADRYAYPSVIGLFIAIVWGICDGLKPARGVALLTASLAIALLAGCSMRQVTFWRDSIAAFSRAVAVTKNNGLGYLNLGSAYLAKGDLPKARENYLKSLEIMPEVPFTWQDLGIVEQGLGDKEAALEDFQRALKYNPKYAKGMVAIGRLLLERGEANEAIPYLQRANELEPLWPEPYITLGNLYAGRARWHEAEEVWAAYLKLDPKNEGVQAALRRAQAAQGKGK